MITCHNQNCKRTVWPGFLYCTACGDLIKNRQSNILINMGNKIKLNLNLSISKDIFMSKDEIDFISLPLYDSILFVNKKTKDLIYLHHTQLIDKKTPDEEVIIPSIKKLKVLPDDEDSILIDHAICGGFFFLRTEKHLYYFPITYLYSDMNDQYLIGNELPGFSLSREKYLHLINLERNNSDKKSFGTIFGYKNHLVIVSDKENTTVGLYNIEFNNERPWQIQRLKRMNHIDYEENYNIFIEKKLESYQRLDENYGDFMFFCTTNTSLEIYQYKDLEEKLNKKTIDMGNRRPVPGSLIIGSLPRLIIQNHSNDCIFKYSVVSERGIRIQDIHSPRAQVEKMYSLSNGNIMALANGLFYDVDEGVGNVSGQPRGQTQKNIIYSDEMIILYAEAALARLFFKQLDKDIILEDIDVVDNEIKDEILVCASRSKAYILIKQKSKLIVFGFEK